MSTRAAKPEDGIPSADNHPLRSSPRQRLLAILLTIVGQPRATCSNPGQL